MLDTSKPDSFGLLHGAWTNGTQARVPGFNIDAVAFGFEDQFKEGLFGHFADHVV